MWMQREESRVKSRILVFEITFSILSANGFNLIFWDSQNHRERERETDIQSDSGYHNPCLPPLHAVVLAIITMVFFST